MLNIKGLNVKGLNVKGLLSSQNLTTIALVAAATAGVLYLAKGQGYISFAAQKTPEAKLAARTDHAIKQLARFIFSHSTNPASLLDKRDQIEANVKLQITTITALVKDRLDKKINGRDYRDKLLVIAKSVAQQMQIVLRSSNAGGQGNNGNGGGHGNGGGKPTSAERLAKINEWFGKRTANINAHGENVTKRLAKLNEQKAKRIARTS